MIKDQGIRKLEFQASNHILSNYLEVLYVSNCSFLFIKLIFHHFSHSGLFWIVFIVLDILDKRQV